MSLDNVLKFKNGHFDNDLNLKKNGKVIILYYADWCGHCNRLKPDYQKLSDLASQGKLNDVTVAAVNADDNDGLIQRIQSKGKEYSVTGFPTIVSYYNGKYFSTYAPDDPSKFRTLEDMIEYANGIGTAQITYVK